MNPAEFTFDFFLVCLSQAKWDSQKPVDIFSREHIKRVAFERGWQEHLPPTQQHFPVASPANEHQTQKQNTMNTLLKEIYDILISPVVAALNRIATALEASGVITPIKEAEPETASDTPAEPAPKKRKKSEPAPAAPAAPEPEPEPEEPYMSGAELCDLMKPLKTTPYNAELVEYRNNVVGFTKPTREMTDPAMLRMMEVKIREFLAANEEAEA
jgi:hypothetical protein